MPALLQIWIVIVTIAMLVIAVLTARMIARHLAKLAADISLLSATISESAEQIQRTAHEIQGLASSARACVTPVHRVVEQFAAIGQRTANVSSTLLDGVEQPVLIAAALSLGAKSAATYLVKGLLRRITHRNSSNNGDERHE